MAATACTLPLLLVSHPADAGGSLKLAYELAAKAAPRLPLPGSQPKGGAESSQTGLILARELGLPQKPQPASPAASPAGSLLLIMEVHLNGVRKGEFTLLALPDGDFFASEADLKAIGVQSPYGTPIEAEGEKYFSLRALQASELHFDETKLALFVTLPPQRLPKKALDLQPGRPQKVLELRDDSAFFNYRALYSGDNAGGAKNLSLATELGIRVGDFLLRSESGHVRGGSARQDIRYGTSLTRDDRRTLQRWTLGDFVSASGDLGSVLNLGGISFSKSYQIDPYFIRQPMAGFIGNIAAPSQAEIYLDGVRVRTETLQPGQFELRNLNYYGGQRNVTVVIRDRFGREQRLETPYYFSDTNLRQGLHEYSYNLGYQRENLGLASNDYGELALSAYHRYGLSDSLTVGGRGEAEAGRFNLGPTLALRSDRLGVVAAGFSAGRNSTGRGSAGIARYYYQAGRLNLMAEARRYTANYQRVGQTAGEVRPKMELGLGASYGMPAFGSLSIDLRRTSQYQGENRRTLSLGYSRTLFGSLSVLASVGRVESSLPSMSSINVFFALTYSPKRDFISHFFHQRQSGSSSEVLQFGNNTPVGEGFGYRIVGERSDSRFGDGYRLSPFLQYNGRHGIYTAEVSALRGSGSSLETYRLGIGGGIAYVGGMFAFSRPIADSFGIVKVGELEGVRVYHSAQDIGRTDAAGTVFLPNLGSYATNRVAIDDRDIPIDYVIAEKELNISPPLRSGSLIRFDIKRIQAVTGRLLFSVAGTRQPAEYLDLMVVRDGREERHPTGRGGEFYIEDLEAGGHPAHFEAGQRRCNFTLIVPESKEMLIDIGELHVCQFDS